MLRPAIILAYYLMFIFNYIFVDDIPSEIKFQN